MPRRFDIHASVHELGGIGSDGAYGLHGHNVTLDEFLASLRQTLSNEWGLMRGRELTPIPSYITIHIGPAGSCDQLPL